MLPSADAVGASLPRRDDTPSPASPVSSASRGTLSTDDMPSAGAEPRAGGFRVPAWYGAALVAALLLASEPYRGVRHDALMYLGQALVRLDPRWWHNDDYFAFGSQDQYSIFSRIFVYAIQYLGIPTAEMLALSLGRLATFGALYWMVDRWPPLHRWLGLAAVAGFAHFYGGKSFSVLEPFVTARTFAEPLSLLAIAAVLRRRKAWAALALALAFLTHPLIALPAALVIWAYLMTAEDWRWISAAVAALPVFLLARAGVAPFDGLLQRYDDAWFRVVGDVNAAAFVSEWGYPVYVAILGYAVVVWLAAWGRTDPLSRLSRVAVVVGPVCCAVFFYVGDWRHNVLLSQLQFWRAIWIGEVLSVLWVPVLVLEQWRRGPVGRMAAAAVCAGLPLVQADMSIYGWPSLLWFTLWAVLSLRQVPIKPGVLRLAFAATVLMGLVALGLHCWEALYELRSAFRGSPLTYPASIPFRIPLLTLGVIGALLAGWQRPRWRMACGAATIALLGLSIWQTDQRTAFTRFVEAATPSERPFQSQIPLTARVYWAGKGIAPVWFLLHRPGFGEIAQYAGALFNRRNAMALQQIGPFMEETTRRTTRCSQLQSWMSRDYRFADCEAPLAEIRLDCARPGQRPDFIVSDVPYPLPREAQWLFRPRDGSTPTTYYLYSCAAIRSSPPPAAK